MFDLHEEVFGLRKLLLAILLKLNKTATVIFVSVLDVSKYSVQSYTEDTIITESAVKGNPRFSRPLENKPKLLLWVVNLLPN